MASESVVRIKEESFDLICSRLRSLEAMADVAMSKPDGLANGTVEICSDSVYFGIIEVRNLILDSISKEKGRGN